MMRGISKARTAAIVRGTRALIFDRYGKLLKEIGAAGIGWDGTFNGQPPLPSDDYWYIVTFETGKVLQGHFALKR